MSVPWLSRLTGWPWRSVGGWTLRVSLIAAILGVIAVRPPYVVIGPPRTVETDHPILCVHTRLNDEVEEWKIQRSLRMVREMGATTIVEFFPWPYIETQPGQFEWGRMDRIVDHANAQGLRVIARLGLVPGWAQPDPDTIDYEVTLNTLTPDHYADFANYVEEFTHHYAGRVDAIIIWNEPNLAFEWGYQLPIDPARYVDLLRLAYPAAKRGNPDVQVLAGALAPTLEPVGSPFGMNDLDYLAGLYEAGFANYYDALAVHSYGFKFPPDADPDPDVLDYRRIELLRDIMVTHGDADKPVIITESGWNDHPRWTKAVRPGQRILYTIGGLQYAEDNWPWLENACVWALRYPIPTRSYPDYFTLVAEDFTPKPIYLELEAWATGSSH